MCEDGVALVADAVRRRHLAIVEDQLGGRRGAHAEFVFQLLAELEAGEPVLDEEQRQRTGTLLARAGVDEKHVAELGFAEGAVGDPHLGAVQHVDVAIAGRGGLHAEHVGADGRLAHAHAADLLARAGVGQVACALHVAGVLVEVVHEQHRVGEIGERESRVCGGELLVDDDGGYRVHLGAAELLGHRDAEDAEVAELPEERDVQRLGAVVLRGLRIDFALDELADGAAQRRVLLGRIEDVGHARAFPMRSTKLSQ